MKNSSITPSRKRNFSPSTPDNSPDAQSELEKLAETSKGESPYSGYRGLLPNKGRHNHEGFTVGGGLEHFNDSRDQHPATVQQVKREDERQARLQSNLDKTVGGTSSRGGKPQKFEGGEAGGANDAALFGR